MANPISFTFNPVEHTFTFSNGPVTIVAETETVPPPTPAITVDTVTLTNHHDSVELGVHDLVVPTPVAEHVFDLV